MRMPTCARGLFLALVAWALGIVLAFAHSGLERAEPPIEGKLKWPPSEVKRYFTDRLKPASSTVGVKDDHGAQVDRQDSQFDPSNPLLLRATLQPFDRGAYSMIWRVRSVDGKATEGRFTFRVE